MADTYGALALPVAGDPDPLLSLLAPFTAAAINAKVAAAWAEHAPNGGVNPAVAAAREVFLWNPAELSFNDKALPALYMFREEIASPNWISEGIRTRASTIVAQWVYPQTPQAKQRGRMSFLNAIASAVDDAYEVRGRVPGFIVTGDTDPTAATRGSFIWSFVNIWSLDLGRARPRPLVIATSSTPMTYPSVVIEMSVVESLDSDDAAYYAPADPGGVALKTTTAPTNGTEITTVDAQFTFPPPTD